MINKKFRKSDAPFAFNHNSCKIIVMGDQNQKTILIWGAGRIGRGFIADLFYDAGYQLVFVDESAILVEQLINAGRYTIVRAPDSNIRQDIIIQDYLALHTSQSTQIEQAVLTADLMAVAIYPKSFPQAAGQLAAYLQKRFKTREKIPLNIFVCTNLSDAASKFSADLEKALTTPVFNAMKPLLGIIGTVILRFASESPVDDPLLVWTNGITELPVNAQAFKGKIPDLNFLRQVIDMHHEEMRKLYTYNMLHTLLAYHGFQQECNLLRDCLEMDAIRKEGQAALQESSQVLQRAAGFSWEDMDMWNTQVWEQSSNPVLGGPVLRMGGEPLRKLARSDRLVAPALLARQHGLSNQHLIKGIAAGFHFNPPEDMQAQTIQNMVRDIGIRRTIQAVCQLCEDEQDLLDQIVIAYHRYPLDLLWQENARKAYWLAFDYEKKYRGCGQCVIASLLETMDRFDERVFESATGLSGGVGNAGDATCSAYLGSVLVFGMLFPRRRIHFDGDRENKYRTFVMAQKLRLNFLNEYGSITCRDIHRHKYGRSFDLMDPTQRQPFEDAGAHGDFGCTLVTAKAARWAVEIIAGEIIQDQIKPLEES
jgi:mannitol-1-phosphate 5-dehydrogenase